MISFCSTGFWKWQASMDGPTLYSDLGYFLEFILLMVLFVEVSRPLYPLPFLLSLLPFQQWPILFIDARLEQIWQWFVVGAQL